jgi:hypothetical protein
VHRDARRAVVCLGVVDDWALDVTSEPTVEHLQGRVCTQSAKHQLRTPLPPLGNVTPWYHGRLVVLVCDLRGNVGQTIHTRCHLDTASLATAGLRDRLSPRPRRVCTWSRHTAWTAAPDAARTAKKTGGQPRRHVWWLTNEYPLARRPPTSRDRRTTIGALWPRVGGERDGRAQAKMLTRKRQSIAASNAPGLGVYVCCRSPGRRPFPVEQARL